MFSFLGAKHGFVPTSDEVRRSRKHRHSTPHVRNMAPCKLARRSASFCGMASAGPLQGDLPKWWQELEAKLQMIEDSTDQEDSEFPNDDGDALKSDAASSHKDNHNEMETNALDIYASEGNLEPRRNSEVPRGRDQQRRNSEPPYSSAGVVSSTETRRGSLPLFTSKKSLKRSMHGKL